VSGEFHSFHFLFPGRPDGVPFVSGGRIVVRVVDPDLPRALIYEYREGTLGFREHPLKEIMPIFRTETRGSAQVPPPKILDFCGPQPVGFIVGSLLKLAHDLFQGVAHAIPFHFEKVGILQDLAEEIPFLLFLVFGMKVTLHSR
jgi:hypothetical protein